MGKKPILLLAILGLIIGFNYRGAAKTQHPATPTKETQVSQKLNISGEQIMGLSWNSWYNPLDNVANVVNTFGQAANGYAAGVTDGTPASQQFSNAASRGGYTSGAATQATPIKNATPGGGGNNNNNNNNNNWSPNVVPTVDPYAAQQAAQKSDALAFLNQQQKLINQQIARLDPTYEQGLENIGNSYNQSYNRLNDQKAVANRDYNTGTADTIQGYQSSRNQVASNMRSRENALQRLLGLAGSGNSSAAFDAVPYAATLEGTQQLAPVQTTYARNRRGLDTSWEDTLRDYGYGVTDLANQKVSQTNALKSSIAQARADLLDKLIGIKAQEGQANGTGAASILASQAGLEAQVKNILDSMAGLGNQYKNGVKINKNVRFSAPELGKYNLGPQGEIATSSPGADNIDPTFLPVLQDKREQDLLSGLIG